MYADEGRRPERLQLSSLPSNTRKVPIPNYLKNHFKLLSIAAVVAAVTTFTGCANSKTYLKSPKTGEVVKCGSVHAVTLAEWAVQKREAQCITDYKEQGFVRVAGPNS